MIPNVRNITVMAFQIFLYVKIKSFSLNVISKSPYYNSNSSINLYKQCM